MSTETETETEPVMAENESDNLAGIMELEKDGQGAARASKNFRNATDIENLFRLISDNDLRREAKMILSNVVARFKAVKKKRKKSKKLQ